MTATIFVTPVLISWVGPSDVSYSRYFMASVIFGLLAAAYGLCAIARKGETALVLAGLIFMMLAFSNISDEIWLSRVGRGNFLEAFRYIEQESPGSSKVTLGADFSVRVSELHLFYGRHLTLDPITVVAAKDWPDAGPDWLIIHYETAASKTKSNMSVRTKQGSTRYDLGQFFPCRFGRGWSWAVYRRAS